MNQPISGRVRPNLRPQVRFQVLRTHDFSCFYCGLPSSYVPLLMDHVIPVALGGTDDLWNLVPACQPCNSGKGSSAPTQSMIERARRVFLSAAYTDYVRCIVCGIPFLVVPGDREDQWPQCGHCNEAICDAFDQGMRHERGVL